MHYLIAFYFDLNKDCVGKINYRKENTIMDGRNTRRTFFKQFLSLSAFTATSLVTFKRDMGARFGKLGFTKKAYAAGNPDYDMVNSKGTIRIEFLGMSCFLITSSNGTRIITDPYKPDHKNVFYADLRKEVADVVTVSCGHYNHCNVFGVGGVPYIFMRTEPAELKGIRFRGVASRCLAIDENKKQDPGDNNIICFEVDNIKICHLGALGHKLSDAQVKEVGKVDILMVPVGGVSSIPVHIATEVCEQLDPKVILPMHYRTERCTFPTWATVDDFIMSTAYVFRCDSNVGSSVLSFRADTLPSERPILVPRAAY